MEISKKKIMIWKYFRNLSLVLALIALIFLGSYKSLVLKGEKTEMNAYQTNTYGFVCLGTIFLVLVWALTGTHIDNLRYKATKRYLTFNRKWVFIDFSRGKKNCEPALIVPGKYEFEIVRNPFGESGCWWVFKNNKKIGSPEEQWKGLAKANFEGEFQVDIEVIKPDW